MKTFFLHTPNRQCTFFLLYFCVTAVCLLPVQCEESPPEATPFHPDVCSWEDYEQALKTFNVGNNYHVSNNLEQAEKYYLKALELFPLFGEAYLNLGNIYHGEKSLWAYKRAAEVIGPESLCPNRPLYANAMSNIGHHLVERQGES